jgi:hypothetical protein
MSMVERLIVETPNGTDVVSLPMDIEEFRALCSAPDLALVIFDPLVSVLDGDLNHHRDADIRKALEPMAKVAEDADVVILGVVHINKSGTTNPLDALMNSRAFGAVPRAVLYVTPHPTEEGVRLMLEPKNNLGRGDLPVLEFTVEGVVVGHEEDGTPIETGRIVWGGESSVTVSEAMSAARDGTSHSEDRTATTAAMIWLREYLTGRGPVEPRTFMDAAIAAGHSLSTIKRARTRLGLDVVNTSTFPKVTTWELLP